MITGLDKTSPNSLDYKRCWCSCQMQLLETFQCHFNSYRSWIFGLSHCLSCLQSNLCPALVGGQASNCYQIGELCCATCRPLIQDNRPEECRFGDRFAGCTEDLCGELSHNTLLWNSKVLEFLDSLSRWLHVRFRMRMSGDCHYKLQCGNAVNIPYIVKLFRSWLALVRAA